MSFKEYTSKTTVIWNLKFFQQISFYIMCISFSEHISSYNEKKGMKLFLFKAD